MTATLNIIDRNTVNGIIADVEAGKRTLKAIAKECLIIETQADNDYAKACYARLADCKTRAQFREVAATF